MVDGQIARVLTDSDQPPFVRRSAFLHWASCLPDEEAVEAVTVLMEMTRNKDKKMVAVAIEALGKLGGEKALARIREILSGSEETMRDATYTDNRLIVPFQHTKCRSVEIQITGYYGGSPGMREFGIFNAR